MGRPIQKKFFANTNEALDGEGVGGEGFSAVTVLTTGTLYLVGTTYTWTGSAPQIAGGEAASGTLSIGTDRRVTAFNVSNAGSGYTSTSSVTVTVSPATTGSAATYHVGLTAAARADGLAIYAYIPASGTAGFVSGSGGTQRLLGDVVRQTGCNKYIVATSEGVGRVKLVSDGVANAAGEADLTATDSTGKTYYVMKLNGRKAKLKQYGSAGHEFADESWVKWNFDNAVEDVSVSIANA
jgi:hypothetical protein